MNEYRKRFSVQFHYFLVFVHDDTVTQHKLQFCCFSFFQFNKMRFIHLFIYLCRCIVCVSSAYEMCKHVYLHRYMTSCVCRKLSTVSVYFSSGFTTYCFNKGLIEKRNSNKSANYVCAALPHTHVSSIFLLSLVLHFFLFSLYDAFVFRILSHYFTAY